MANFIYVYQFIPIGMFRLAFSFQETSLVYTTNHAFKSLPAYSQSSVLSIAGHIVETFPQLRPPNLHQSSISFEGELEKRQKNSYHPYFQLWVHNILDCYLSGHAVLDGSIIYVQVSLSRQMKDFFSCEFTSLYSTKQIEFTENLSPQARISKIFGIPLIHKQGKMAIFDNNKFNSSLDPLAPQINDPAIFVGKLFNNYQWKIIKVADGIIPSVEQIMTFNGVILTGSYSSVLDTAAQMERALANLIQAYQRNKNLKIFGVCYGHHLISNHFKAVIAKKRRMKGLQSIKLESSILEKLSFFQPIRGETFSFMSQYHEDYVETVPKGFNLVAKSKSCEVQMLLSQDSRILTSQFHIEYSCKFAEEYVLRNSGYRGRQDESKFYVKSSEHMEKKNLEDCQRWTEVLARFFAEKRYQT